MVSTLLTQRSDAERHDTFGEPDVMRMFEWMLQEHRAMSEVAVLVERLVQRNE